MYLFQNGVLRLLSLDDESWKRRLSPYFEIERLDYFAWPNEKKETRRLFLLKKITRAKCARNFFSDFAKSFNKTDVSFVIFSRDERMNDASMIKKLKLRHENTFSAFFSSYKNLVFYECDCVLHDREDAEDVTQDVFVEFFNNVDKLKETTNLKLHIASLAKRRAIDLYRKKARNPLQYSDQMEDYGEPDFHVAPELTLGHLLEEKEANVVTLRVIYEYSFREVAEETGLTLGRVQGIYYQAVKKLKAHYKKGN